MILLLWCSPHIVFAEDASVPKIYYLDVESGPAGVFVTLNGSGFTHDDIIKMGDVRCHSLPQGNQYPNLTPEMVPSKVTVTVPVLPEGRYAVTVQNASGISNSLFFTVRPGSIYFIAKNGSDNHPGTLSAPFLTLDHAARQIKAGDFVYIRNGTYRENADKGEDCIFWGNSGSAYYEIKTSGSRGKPITVQSYPGERAIFTMNKRKPGVINIDQAHYLNFVALVFNKVEASGISAQNSNGIRIINCEFYDIAWVSYGTGAIWVWTDTDSVKILGNSLHDTGAYDQGSNITHSIYAQGQNMEIAYNKIWDEPGVNDLRRANSGLQSYGRKKPVLNMHIHHNLFYGLERGIILAGTPRNTYIYNNIFHDMDRMAIQNVPGNLGGPVFLYNNTFYNNGRNPRIWEGAVHISTADADARDFVAKNNIFYSEISDLTISGKINNADIDYNIYFVKNGFPQRSPGNHSQIIDPQFVNIDKHDIRLSEDSPAIDIGFDTGHQFRGAAPDMGALELGSIFLLKERSQN